MAPGSGPLLAFALVSLGVLAASLLLMLVDPRQVLGASTWLKPAKFAISFVINAGMIALLLRWLQPLTRGTRRAVGLIVGTLTVEMVIITGQAARGVPSHFNSATALDGVLFTVMGASISVAWGAMVYLTWRAFRQRFANRALGWGIRMGLLAMVLGSALGFVMPRPTAAQLETLAAGRPTPQLGGHAVGVPDGGPGLPVTGWSTEGGDLRIPHFVGMHGLQLLPLVGWLLGRRRPSGRAARLTVVAGLGYLGITGVLLAQALRGQPLLAPDGWTIFSLVAVVLATLAAAALAAWKKTGAPARAQLGHPVPEDGAFA